MSEGVIDFTSNKYADGRKTNAKKERPSYVDTPSTTPDENSPINLFTTRMGLEKRVQQRNYSDKVDDFIDSEYDILFAEGATGCGKSLGYLVPLGVRIAEAASDEESTKMRVVIATSTKQLQHQLLEKDLPMLRDYISTHYGHNIRFGIGIGASNYVCKLRLYDYLSSLKNTGNTKINAKLVEFLKQDGRLWNYNDDIDFRVVDEVNVVRDSCAGQGCEHYRSCPYIVDKMARKGADIVVTNHHFALLAHPKGHVVIFDEADNLPDNAALLFDNSANTRTFRNIGRNLKKRLAFMKAPIRIELTELYTKLSEEYYDLLGDLESIFGDLEPHDPTDNITLDAETRMVLREEFKDHKFFNLLSDFTELIGVYSANINSYTVVKGANQQKLFTAKKIHFEHIISKLAEVSKLFWDFMLEPKHDDDKTCLRIMATQSARGKDKKRNFIIKVIPIDTSVLVEEHAIMANTDAKIIFTSATLSEGDRFSFLASQTGVNEANIDKIIVSSPFDYENNVSLEIAENLNVNGDKDYWELVANDIIERFDKAPDGEGFMILTTAYNAIVKLVKILHDFVPNLWVQGEGLNVPTIIKNHLKCIDKKEKSMIVGTNTFWKGIDFRGNYLKHIFIPRLPFKNPADEVTKARSNLYCLKYGTQHAGYTKFIMPDAVRTFKQGFGRLIRGPNDKGTVVVYDSRILDGNKRIFINSIPQCKEGTFDLRKKFSTCKQCGRTISDSESTFNGVCRSCIDKKKQRVREPQITFDDLASILG